MYITPVGHDFLEDKRLSFKARGVLAYVFHFKGPWTVRVEELIKASDEDGRISIQSALHELIKWEYAEIKLVRDKHGRVKGKEYYVYNVPIPLHPNRQAGFMPVGTDKQVSCSSENMPVGEQESGVDTSDSQHIDVTDKQETRQSENLSVGTDKQVSRQTQNMPIGENGTDVDTGDDRRAGFPSDRKTVCQETCLTTKDKNLREEETQDKTLPPVAPPQTLPAVNGVHAAVQPKRRPARFVPENFVVTDEMRQWANKDVPGLNIDFETSKFRDYEFKVGRSDWNMAWRNWMRKAWEVLPPEAKRPERRRERKVEL